MLPSWENLKRITNIVLVIFILMMVLGYSVLPPGDEVARVRSYIRDVEFDYVEWTLNAFAVKLGQSAIGGSTYLPDDEASELVREYATLIGDILHTEAQLNIVLADPTLADPESAAAELRENLDAYYARKAVLGPLAESILQAQITTILQELDLTVGGQPIPSVMFHNTPVPAALIVSSRSVIQQEYNISVSPDLTIDERIAIEDDVAAGVDVSTLIVPIGGIGTYPTMVYQTSSINWLAEIVAHEWIHNYLNLRPLGLSYLASPELRTMNETTAALAGKEIGAAVIARYYPELVPPPPPPPAEESETETPPAEPDTPPPFDYNAEMRITRVTVDEMLAQGEIEKAEAYMEVRRQYMWENGYYIRKLNQAYFAFYGAYADVPGGAAGVDPVGPAVRALRGQNASLVDFLNQISWMWTFEQLQAAIEE